MKKVVLRQFKDNRGILVENTLASIMKDSKHFFISKSKPGVVRGNHYHKKKSEWFYLIQGTCKVCVEDIKTKEKEVFKINSRDNVILHMEPGKAHAFKNTSKKEMILLGLVNEVLNQDNPDTYQYILLK